MAVISIVFIRSMVPKTHIYQILFHLVPSCSVSGSAEENNWNYVMNGKPNNVERNIFQLRGKETRGNAIAHPQSRPVIFC